MQLQSHYDPTNTSLKLVGSSALKRVNLHSLTCGLQVMVIHMEAQYTYDFILDNCNGLISFTVLSGCLYVDTLDEPKLYGVKNYTLMPSSVLLIPRNIYRKTYTKASPAVYVEHIENGFRPDVRIKRDSPAN